MQSAIIFSMQRLISVFLVISLLLIAGCGDSHNKSKSKNKNKNSGTPISSIQISKTTVNILKNFKSFPVNRKVKRDVYYKFEEKIKDKLSKKFVDKRGFLSGNLSQRSAYSKGITLVLDPYHPANIPDARYKNWNIYVKQISADMKSSQTKLASSVSIGSINSVLGNIFSFNVFITPPAQYIPRGEINIFVNVDNATF